MADQKKDCLVQKGQLKAELKLRDKAFNQFSPSFLIPQSTLSAPVKPLNMADSSNGPSFILPDSGREIDLL